MRESMDGLIQKMLSARARRNSEACANENLMAAYLEGSLSPEEMTGFESHVLECIDCQEILAMAMKLKAEGNEEPEVIPADTKKTLFHFSIPIPALGALLIVAILGVVFFRFAHHSGEKPPATSVAELRQAVQKSTESHPSETLLVAESHPPVQAAKTTVRNAPAASSVSKPFDSDASAPNMLTKDKKAADLVVADIQAMLESNNEKGKAFAPMREDVPPPAPAAVSKLEIPQPLPVETAAQTPGNAFAPPVVQETIARPKIYAAQNRIATVHYTDLEPVKSLTPAESLSVVINTLSLPANVKAAKSRKIGDRTFLRVSGPWVDKQCVEHSKAQIVEIAPEAPEYESILKRFPDMRAILPAVIYWEGKNYFLQK